MSKRDGLGRHEPEVRRAGWPSRQAPPPKTSEPAWLSALKDNLRDGLDAVIDTFTFFRREDWWWVGGTRRGRSTPRRKR